MLIDLISILANKAHGKRKYISRISSLVQSSSDHVNPSLILARLVKGAYLTLIIYHGTPDPRVSMQFTTSEIIARYDLHHAAGSMNFRSSIISGVARIMRTALRCYIKVRYFMR